jgi:uncharacterized protein (TIGR03066 family)
MRTKRKKHQSQAAPQGQPVPGARPPRLRWPLVLLGLLVLVGLLSAGGTWALFEFVVWNRVPTALVGKWVVTEGPDEGGTVDFYRNGTMVAKVNNGGMEGIIEARVRVEGDKIHVTTRNRETGEEGVRVQTIKVLDAHRLVLQDERGMSVNLERTD